VLLLAGDVGRPADVERALSAADRPEAPLKGVFHGAMVIDDASRSALVTPQWIEAFGLRSILVVPLISGDRVIGTLSLDETRAQRVWSPDQTSP
jgi:GAF domain-containing protein